MYILIVLYFGNTIQYFSDNVSLKYSACFAINVRNYLHWFRHICILFGRPTKKEETDVLQGETFKRSLKLLLGVKSYRWDVNQPIVFCLKAAASKGTPLNYILLFFFWCSLIGQTWEVTAVKNTLCGNNIRTLRRKNEDWRRRKWERNVLIVFALLPCKSESESITFC